MTFKTTRLRTVSMIALSAWALTLTPLAAFAEEPKSVLNALSPYEEALGRILKRVDWLLSQNEYEGRREKSLKLILEGGKHYLGRRDYDGARKSLRKALDADSKNPLAHLLYGDVSAMQGKKDVAGFAYIEFWNRAQKERAFLRGILEQNDREAIASHVSGKLFIYGLDIPDKSHPKDLPLMLEMADKKESVPRALVNFGFPILLGLGIPFLIYRRTLSADPSPSVDRFLLQVYFVLLVSYLFWLAHQWFKLKPLFLSAEWEVLIAFAVGLNLIFGFQLLMRFIEHERERRNPETLFCPHCAKSILKLAIVCPFCNQKIL